MAGQNLLGVHACMDLALLIPRTCTCRGICLCVVISVRIRRITCRAWIAENFPRRLPLRELLWFEATERPYTACMSISIFSDL